MKRGDIVIIVTSGDYGKPRPALIVQADAYSDLASVTVLPLTSELHDLPLLRITIEAAESTGLRVRSQVMVDKPTTVPRAKVGLRVGRVDPESLTIIDRALAKFLGLT